MIDWACWAAVVVLPHHLGPSIKTAPIACKRWCNNSSEIRLKYLISVSFFKFAAKVLIIIELRKLFYIFEAFYFTFLGHFILHFWGNSLGKIVVNTILFDIHKNYIVMNNSRVYAVISIFQRSLWARRASVACSGAALSVRKRTFHAPMVRFMRQSRVVWLFYVVARGRGALFISRPP